MTSMQNNLIDNDEIRDLNTDTYKQTSTRKSEPPTLTRFSTDFYPRATQTSTEISNRDSMSREQMNTQRIIGELEKKVVELTNEVERTKKENTESMDLIRTHVRKIRQLETELSQVKIVNNSVIEDNKGYQLTLRNKDNECQKLKEKYEEERAKNSANKDKNSHEKINSMDSNDDMNHLGERVHKESDHTLIEELQNEIKTLKDDNQSMNQYIQKMLKRIMEVKDFEETLATDWTPKPLPKANDPIPIANKRTSVIATQNVSHELFNKPLINSLSDFKYPRHPTTVNDSSPSITTSSSSSLSSISSPYTPTSIDPSFFLPPMLDNSSMTATTKEVIYCQEPEEFGSLPTIRNPTKKHCSDDAIVFGGTQRPPVEPLKRSQTMSANASKRFSFLKWNKPSEESTKKADPYMRPILLVQAKEMVNKE